MVEKMGYSRPLRGFNLLEKFAVQGNSPFRELDFQRMAEWGFNFVRLPMDYRCWTIDGDYYRIDEKVLKEIDYAIEYGKRYGIHVNINFHRAPGYCINPPLEQLNLWRDKEALEACAYHWRIFTERYKEIPKELLSFNLVNEPLSDDLDKKRGATMPEYKLFVTTMLRAIRETDETRLVIADGLMTKYNYKPIIGVDDPLLGQSFHMYEPMWLTHLGANWTRAWFLYDEQPEYPGIPSNIHKYFEQLPSDSPLREEYLKYKDVRIDQKWLNEWMRPYLELKEKGVFVHCGELGVYSKKVPRQSQLNWYKDVLGILNRHNIGWAQWNLRGPFGIIDTGREEFNTEKLPNGDMLDKEMLKLIRRYIT
jgi:endoglucanase